MDKIYSRKRIKIPNVTLHNNNKKIKKIYFFCVIWIVAILTVVTIAKAMNPIFEKLCVEKAKGIGTKILNDESTRVIKNVNYEDLIMVSKDKNDSITMVKSNVVLINLLASEITSNIQKEIEELKKTPINIPLR